MTVFPNGGKTSPAVSSPFGPRDPRVGISSLHAGADLIGFDAVRAIAAGRVTIAGWMNDAAGYTVALDHGNGVTSMYMHLRTVNVSKGASVAEGAQIGLMGSSGNATGKCCHYEIRLQGKSVEPIGWTATRISAESVPAFPLPAGWYFGPKSGPRESVSGFYGHGGDLQRWQLRMRDRGWKINPDGRYGTETAGVARAFQAEKGLTVDGKIGPATWAAAWTAPVT